MDNSLDDMDIITTIDREQLLQTLIDIPENSKKTIEDTFKTNLYELPTKTFNNLVIAGMGGSAIGGLLLRDWLYESSEIPVYVSRGYHLPSWVDQNTLVYVASYSGNTEETLRQFNEALEIGCSIICFSSGGVLSQRAIDHRVPLVAFPKGIQPRAAIAFQFFSLASVHQRLGLVVDELWAEVDEAIRILKALTVDLKPETRVESNPGKTLALGVKGHIPFVYGSRLYEGVVYRYTTQFNENSKTPAASGFFPEVFHNSIMAREGHRDILEKICLILIRDPFDEKMMVKKVERFKELMAKKHIQVFEVKPLGKGRLARMFSTLIIGVYACVFLAILNGEDPSSISSINKLKNIS